MKRLNIYCDESGHLEHDEVGVMVLGALWHDAGKTREIAERLREIKAAHGVPADFEIKWTKATVQRRALFLALLDYFFDDDDLHFRAVVVPDKPSLTENGGDHDDGYYHTYYVLLKVLIDPGAENFIYLDIKDTQGAAKVRQLHTLLAESHFDFDRSIIRRIQQVRSHEVEQMQIADLLIGAVSYAYRGLEGNAAKVALVRRMQQRSGKTLIKSTLHKERKVNLLIQGDQ